MILEYHRPNDIDEAMLLLNRDIPVTIPLAGGNLVSRNSGRSIAVVDLQNLNLNQIHEDGTTVELGAMVTLEQLFEHHATPEALKEAIHIDATVNTRNTATIGGTVAAATGASALMTALLAMDTRLNWLPGDFHQSLGEFISLKNKISPGKLIVSVQIPLQAKVRISSVGRSPLDPPFLNVAVAIWPSGRTRLALGGKGQAPILAVDGATHDGIIEAGINACSQLSNQWASIDYLKDITSKIIRRLTSA